MIFVRLAVNTQTGEVIGAMSQDVPFETGSVAIAGASCEMLDLGVVEDHEWTSHERLGEPASVNRHLVERLRAGGVKRVDIREKRASAALHVEGLYGLAEVAAVLTIQDVPCTMKGLKQRLREKGPDGIPVNVRAWLANVLPCEQCEAMGLARRLPISAMKAAEALRNRRDPAGGSRMHVLERAAQAQSDGHAAARLRAKKRREARAMAKAAPAAVNAPLEA